MPTSNGSRTQILISYLKNKPIEDAELVKSPGDAWQLIVRQTNYEELFDDLEANGIIPTTVELSECNNIMGERQGQNTWFILFRYAYFPLINKLFTQNIIPTAALLAQSTEDGSNTWYWLSSSVKRIECFLELLKRGIVPTANMLAQSVKQGEHKGKNGWYWLSGIDERSACFLELLKRGIVPTANMLAQSTEDGSNTWYWLSGSDERSACFLELLNRGIVPTANLLAQSTKDGSNTWYWLSGTDERSACFLELLKRGIVPTANMLAQSVKQGEHKGKNGWYWLSSSNKRIEGFIALLNRGIVPTANMLAQVSQEGEEVGANGWYWLSGSDERSVCFLELLNRGIVPTSAMLAQSTKLGRSSWYRLSFSSSVKRRECFLALLNRGIVPTAAMLAQSPKQRENNEKDSWHWLTLTDKRREIFHRLYQLDILPSLSTFSLLDKKKLSKEYKRAAAIDRWMKQENITENLARLMTRSAAHLKYVNQVFLLIFLSSFNSDILFYMVSYLFPNWCDTKTLKEIFKNENNMLYFSRQLVTPRLYNYSRKIVIYHRERAQSVLETMKASISIDSDNSQKVDKVDIDHSLYKLLASQWVMFKNPGKTPYQPVIKKHHEPITSKSIKDDFEKKLRESTHDLHLIKQSIKRIR